MEYLILMRGEQRASCNEAEGVTTLEDWIA